MILTAERARLLSWFLVFFFSGYLFTGYVHVGSPTEGFLATSIDSTVPLLTWSIWIYCIHFLVMISSFFLIADPDSLRTFAGAVAISLVVSFLTFFLFPTIYPRPCFSTDGATWYLWEALYVVDVRTNCFPSLHISLASCYSYWLVKKGGNWRIAIPALFVMTSVSVLTTKQHYLVDIIGGVAVAIGAVYVSERVHRSRGGVPRTAEGPA
jgi:membrane-associated phospholipid phosphatase